MKIWNVLEYWYGRYGEFREVVIVLFGGVNGDEEDSIRELNVGFFFNYLVIKRGN